MVGEAVEGMPWLGTFHSIGAKILRRHAELVGLKTDFTILDTDDQIRLMKQIIARRQYRREALAGAAVGLDDRRLEEPRADAGRCAAGEGGGFADGRGKALYAAYQERLKTLNAADFGDLLLHNLRIFREHADVLAQYQNRFRYMLVDEYQDTNVAQYLWLRLLAQGEARPQPLLRRRRRPVDLRLARRRGRQHPALRARFPRREGDPARAQLPLDRPYPRRRRASDRAKQEPPRQDAVHRGRAGRQGRRRGRVGSEEEARSIGDEIETLQRDGHALSQIAILVRASFQMREFEDRFVTLGLPYRVIGGPRFYERQEIRDALAYFRVVVSPTHDLAFERIVNVPKRGLGDATLQQLHEYARRSGVPLLRSRARAFGHRGAEAEAARGAARSRRRLRPLARAARAHAAHRAGRDGARGIRLHRHVAEGAHRRRRRAGSRT